MMPTCNAHVQLHHVAVLTENFVTFTCMNVFLNVSSILVTQFGRSLTPRDNKFVMSSSSDCNRSPDAWAGRLWNFLRADDDEASCCFFGIEQWPSKSDATGSATCEFLVTPGKSNRSPDTLLGQKLFRLL